MSKHLSKVLRLTRFFKLELALDIVIIVLEPDKPAIMPS